jgi:ATP-binding cassette subfamily B (MDR/TAP) protein 6
MLDIAAAVAYLGARLTPGIAAVVAFTVAGYVPLTVLITERRGKVRRVMNALDTEREGRAADVLLGYEAVKLFTAEALELAAYDAATRKYQVRFV